MKEQHDIKSAAEVNFRLLNCLNEGVLLVNLDGKMFYSNKRSSEITGYSCDELKRLNFLTLVHPDFREKKAKDQKGLIPKGG